MGHTYPQKRKHAMVNNQESLTASKYDTSQRNIQREGMALIQPHDEIIIKKIYSKTHQVVPTYGGDRTSETMQHLAKRRNYRDCNTREVQWQEYETKRLCVDKLRQLDGAQTKTKGTAHISNDNDIDNRVSCDEQNLTQQPEMEKHHIDELSQDNNMNTNGNNGCRAPRDYKAMQNQTDEPFLVLDSHMQSSSGHHCESQQCMKDISDTSAFIDKDELMRNVPAVDQLREQDHEPTQAAHRNAECAVVGPVTSEGQLHDIHGRMEYTTHTKKSKKRRKNKRAKGQQRRDKEERETKRNTNEHQSRRDTKERQTRRNANELQSRRDTKERETKRNTNEHQSRRDTKERQTRRSANELQSRRDTKERQTKRNAKELVSRRNTKERQAKRNAKGVESRRDTQEEHTREAKEQHSRLGTKEQQTKSTNKRQKKYTKEQQISAKERQNRRDKREQKTARHEKGQRAVQDTENVSGTEAQGNELYKCSICSIILETTIELNFHLQTKHGIGTYRCYSCPSCHTVFSTCIELGVHAASIHNEKEDHKKCPQCPRKFKYKSTLLAHHIAIHALKMFSCYLCGRKYSRRSVLKTHYKGVHGMKIDRVCSICHKVCLTYREMKLHLQNHTDFQREAEEISSRNVKPVTEVRLQYLGSHCDACSKSFDSNEAYMDHINTTHRVIVSDLLKRMCSDKDKMAISTNCLKTDGAGNSDVGYFEYQCYKCSYAVPSFALLHDHLEQEHPNIMVQTVGCTYPQCGQKFESYRDLEKHVYDYHDEKESFRHCKQCHFQFYHKTSYDVHVNISHTNSGPFICTFCTTRKTTLAQFTTHLKNYHRLQGIFPFSICKHDFPSLAKRDYHRSIKHGHWTWFCEDCNLGFHRKRQYLIHRNKEHVDCSVSGRLIEINDVEQL